MIQQAVEPPLGASTWSSLTFCMTLSSSHIVVEELWPTLLCNTASAHWVAFQIWLWLQHWLFSFSDLLLCLASMHNLDQVLADRWPHIWLYSALVYRVHSWLNVCKVPKLLPIHHRVWQLGWSVCADMLRLVFLKCGIVHYSKHLYFGLDYPMDIFPEILWFFRCNLQLFREKMLSSGNPSKQAIVFKPFSNCTGMKMLTEAYRDWDVTLSDQGLTKVRPFRM